MTTEELQKIVECAELSLIEKKLREQGFRNAKNAPDLCNASLVDIVHSDGAVMEDVCKGKLLYRATLYQNVKGFENYFWVWLEVLKAQNECKQRRKERRTDPFPDLSSDDEITYFPHQIIIYAKERTDSER